MERAANPGSWSRLGGLACAALAVLWVGLGTAVADTARGVSVAPGTIIRWPGTALERCGLASRTWEPLAGACWYPIDLLAPEGALEVARWYSGGRREVATIVVGAYPYEVQHITLADDSKVDLSRSDVERVERENRQIAALWSLETPRQFRMPLGSPLAELPPGGRFGARRFFNDQPRSPHSGADFTAAAGTPILSIAAGTVVLTGDFFFSGRSVFVDHGDGLISMYFHMSGIGVESGDAVAPGEILGLVGDTGRATGAHLHLGVRWHGERIDPQLLMQPIESVPALP